ncbi:hypothetical protein H6P81_018171 [Aristolochia fimbriata]|uniref:Uncharacterized protein n=1 Tax=Aristolochia fimbriata TaxID=158543 RepID=A0AAV7E4I8_ARIFI|nr:hypothetical protein H6P81_018171 [Aristolochia fimbriata]
MTTVILVKNGLCRKASRPCQWKLVYLRSSKIEKINPPPAQLPTSLTWDVLGKHQNLIVLGKQQNLNRSC